VDTKGLKGKVQTVLGLIEPEELGITLIHEHILTDLSVFFVEPEEASVREISRQPVSLDNLWFVRYRFFDNIDNLRFTDENLMTKEAMRYKVAGGSSIVELSNIGLFRDPLGLQRVSRATGLNIVMGSGFYIAMAQKPATHDMSADEIADLIVKEIIEGVGNTGVKAGVIGEIGNNSPIDPFEKKSLRGAAIAQQRTGAMINIHPSHKDDLVLENVRILKEAGADLSRVVVSHVDGWRFTEDVILRLLDEGCIVEYDHFGFEGYYPPYHGHHMNMFTDEDKIKAIQKLIAKGYIEQITAASDHCMKHLLASYGGGGYDHMLRNVVPLMRVLGMRENEIDTLLVNNPARLLAFVDPK
jgi:phosphotriesterase-related protein